VQRHELERLAIGIGHLGQRGETAADRIVQPEGRERCGGRTQHRIFAGQLGFEAGPQGRVRSPEGRGRERGRTALGSSEQGQHLFRQVPVDRQDGARHLHDPAHRHDPGGDDVPCDQRLRRRALSHADRVAAANEVAREEALARAHVADLMEAHDRALQRLDVGAVHDGFLPAAPLEIIGAQVAAVLPGHRAGILEGTVHRDHRRGSDHLRQLVDVDIVQVASPAEVLLHQFAHPLPPGVAARPIDESGGTALGLGHSAPPGPLRVSWAKVRSMWRQSQGGLACR
jgi:hypothetical protein